MKRLVFLLVLMGLRLEAAAPRSVEEWISFLPGSKVWDQQLRTGVLPLLDPEGLTASAWLPDPLRFSDGRDITRPDMWKERRAELLLLFEHYVTGRMPPPPDRLRVAEFRDSRANGINHRTLTLVFNDQEEARLRVELFVPDGPGPFPVFLTQANHRAWALVAASRGYLGCVYAGADTQDDTPRFAQLWPNSDATLLTRRAWAGSRSVDYLLTLPEVNREQIAVVGHSRNGKQSLIAAAFDERIAGVVAVAGFTPMRTDTADRGTGGVARWSHWLPLLPRLGAFVGYEDKIPYDYHDLLSLIAPRRIVLVQPTTDYHATLADVRTCVDRVRQRVDADAVTYVEVDDYNRYSRKVADEVLKQLKTLLDQ